MSGLIRAQETAKHTIGPMSFYAAMNRETAEGGFLFRTQQQWHWSWPQWDRFFALAEEHGMTAVDEYGEGKHYTAILHFKQTGNALLQSWRRVRAAKKARMTALEFHIAEGRRIAEEKQRLDEMIKYQETRRAAEMAASADSGQRRVSARQISA